MFNGKLIYPLVEIITRIFCHYLTPPVQDLRDLINFQGLDYMGGDSSRHSIKGKKRLLSFHLGRALLQASFYLTFHLRRGYIIARIAAVPLLSGFPARSARGIVLTH
jgi:hypothetical protein